MYKDYKRALIFLAVLFFTSKPILAQNWADIGFSYYKDPNSTPPKVLFYENIKFKWRLSHIQDYQILKAIS